MPSAHSKHRHRVACSGRARGVLDFIDRREQEAIDAERPTRTLTIPIQPGVYCLLQVPTPLHEHEWDSLHRVLDAMKIGLVKP
jgi:hypothetical protein